MCNFIFINNEINEDGNLFLSGSFSSNNSNTDCGSGGGGGDDGDDDDNDDNNNNNNNNSTTINVQLQKTNSVCFPL